MLKNQKGITNSKPREGPAQFFYTGFRGLLKLGWILRGGVKKMKSDSDTF